MAARRKTLGVGWGRDHQIVRTKGYNAGVRRKRMADGRLVIVHL